MNTTFWDKYKVLIMALIGALTITLQEFIGDTGPVNYPALLLALGLTILAFFAKEWRGQGMTITGIIGVAADTIYTLYQTGSFSWERAGLLFLVAVGTAAVPDPKSRGYEHTEVIKQAKAEGEQINPAALTAKPKQ